MRLGFQVRGDLQEIIQDETAETARGLRDGIAAAGKALQEDLRNQTRTAFPRVPGLANAWRMAVYPRNPFTLTLHPAASVYVPTKKKDGTPTTIIRLIEAFDEGSVITAKRAKWLTWPTPYNATGGRRNAGSRGGVRVTPQEMAAAKGQTVVLPSRTAGISLWCLRLRQAQGFGSRSKGKTQLYLGLGNRNVRVATGKLKKGDKEARIQELAGRGIIPMFFMARTVSLPKKLDIDGAIRDADTGLVGHIERALNKA
ncbi:DUF6441 family protein [Roseomonas chloroacetimidivorans]|uniref:DUF6441 family protein n=1 Tax=Roseomonas chloroacetimidivorans TaxID=1766656 RepID=UPI003C71649F